MRLIQQDNVAKEPHAVASVINIHTAVIFDTRDKPRMERMCRYLARPPIVQQRLTRRSDGSVQYTMKKAWRDGASAIVLQPLDLIARLCAMIPPPRLNMIRVHGVFAPNAKRRSEVVPTKKTRKLAEHSAGELGDAEQIDLFGDEPLETKRNPWAWLLKKVFLVDVTECPTVAGACDGSKSAQKRATSIGCSRCTGFHLGLRLRPNGLAREAVLFLLRECRFAAHCVRFDRRSIRPRQCGGVACLRAAGGVQGRCRGGSTLTTRPGWVQSGQPFLQLSVGVNLLYRAKSSSTGS